MRPRNRVDAIELNEPQIFDQTQKIVAFAGSCRLVRQTMPVQEKPTRGLIVERDTGHSPTAQRVAV